MSEVQKLKLELGSINIEYEGDLGQLELHLPKLLEIASNYKPVSAPSLNLGQPAVVTGPTLAANTNGKIEATTNTIAAKLNCNSCPELIKAAAVQLTLVQGKPKFTRQELAVEMKTSSYYKETYMGNLSKYLKTLLKAGFLNEVQKDVFAVNPNQLAVLEAQVA